MKEGKLIPLRRGLYLISKPYSNTFPNLFEIAQLIYGPSYISLESALAYHHWIPEAVYTTTSVSFKRNALFNTSIGQFHFSYVPNENFYMGVERVETKEAVFLKALNKKAEIF
jgi:predicted transcriptional regulator of viral defense system